jgi:hypothetical protein
LTLESKPSFYDRVAEPSTIRFPPSPWEIEIYTTWTASLLCGFILDIEKKLAELEEKLKELDEEVKTLKSRLDKTDAPKF